MPLKIYADFEYNMKGVKSNDKSNASYTKKYRDYIPCRFSYKIVCIDDKFSKPVVPYRGKNLVNKFIRAILEEHHYCKKSDKKSF